MARVMPPHWRAVFDAAGYASATDLAERMGVAVTTITRLIHGEGTSIPVARQAAEMLGVTTEEVWALSRQSSAYREPFVLPDSAAGLSPAQRKAILALIRVMLEPDPTQGAATEESAT